MNYEHVDVSATSANYTKSTSFGRMACCNRAQFHKVYVLVAIRRAQFHKVSSLKRSYIPNQVTFEAR